MFESTINLEDVPTSWDGFVRSNVSDLCDSGDNDTCNGSHGGYCPGPFTVNYRPCDVQDMCIESDIERARYWAQFSIGEWSDDPRCPAIPIEDSEVYELGHSGWILDGDDIYILPDR